MTDERGPTAQITPAPELTIVVGLIAGGREPISECLGALEADAVRMGVECIVPYDHRLDGVEDLSRRFPWARFVDARARVDPARYGRFSREHHDILRAIGLNQARGRIVALLEDHGTPIPGWCANAVAVHAGPAAAVGGSVGNGVDRLLNWAVYFCDFGRYQDPVPAGPSEFVSDSNVTYKRGALESVRPFWEEAFHETAVNWELRRMGHELVLDSRLAVHQARRTLRLWPALLERFVWGRSFAGTRARSLSLLRRAVYAALAFALPAVLTARIVRVSVQRGRYVGRMLASLPLIAVLQSVWALGEMVGYVSGRPSSTRAGG